MSPTEAKRKHSATDLLRWQQRFDDEANEFHREDYGVARVAYEVYELRAALCAFLGLKLEQRQPKDFLVKFIVGTDTPVVLSEEEREEEIKRISAASQAAWFVGMGLDANGKPKGQTPARESPKTPNPPVPMAPGQDPQKNKRRLKPGGGD